jgi:hypothetical protein
VSTQALPDEFKKAHGHALRFSERIKWANASHFNATRMHGAPPSMKKRRNTLSFLRDTA